MDPFPDQVDGCACLLLQMAVYSGDGFGKLDISQNVVKTDNRQIFRHTIAGTVQQGDGVPCLHIAEGEKAGYALIDPGTDQRKNHPRFMRTGKKEVLFRNSRLCTGAAKAGKAFP